MGYEHRTIPLRDRINNYTVNQKTGCWEWQGTIRIDGYGAISFQKKRWTAHRLSWTFYNGLIPSGLDVLHKCDVRHCVNPDHLFLGTHQDNMRDRDAKGRLNHVSGVKHPNSKLNPEKAFDIRWLAAIGYQQRQLAKSYGVTQRAVAQLIYNKTWIQECHD